MEFGNLAKEQIGDLPKKMMEGVDKLEETFNGNQKQSMVIQTDEISSVKDIQEQRTWKFDWKTVASRSYAGGFVSWTRVWRALGADGVEKGKNRAATQAEVKARTQAVFGSGKMTRKHTDAVKLLVDDEVKKFIGDYYEKKLGKLAEGIKNRIKKDPARGKEQLTALKREGGKTDLQAYASTSISAPVQGAVAFGRAVHELMSKRGSTIDYWSSANAAYEEGNYAELAARIAEDVANSESPKLEAKYDTLRRRYLLMQQEERWKARHGGQELDDEAKAAVAAAANRIQLKQYDTKFGVSAVVGFEARYSIIAVDEESIERRFKRLENDLNEWKDEELTRRHLKVLDVIGRAREMESKSSVLLNNSINHLLKIDETVNQRYEDKKRELEDAREAVTKLIGRPGFKQRIGSFKLSPVASVDGLPVRVHSWDSNVNIDISMYAWAQSVKVHVEYEETAEGIAGKLPQKNIRESGDIIFGLDGVTSPDDFGKQWIRNSRPAK